MKGLLSHPSVSRTSSGTLRNVIWGIQYISPTAINHTSNPSILQIGVCPMSDTEIAYQASTIPHRPRRDGTLTQPFAWPRARSRCCWQLTSGRFFKWPSTNHCLLTPRFYLTVEAWTPPVKCLPIFPVCLIYLHR